MPTVISGFLPGARSSPALLGRVAFRWIGCGASVTDDKRPGLDSSRVGFGLACLVLALAAVAVLLPFLTHLDWVLAPRSGLGTDISYRHWPDLTNLARALREHGQIPLWDDSVALGRPLAGDPGVLWLYPFALIFLVAPPSAAFTLLALIHMLLAGLLAAWFFRVGLQTSRMAALIGGLAFMLMPKLIAHLAGGHVGLVYGVTWLPLAMLGTQLAVERGQWPGALLTGIALSLQVPTHVQIPFYTAVLVSAYAVWLWLPHPGRRDKRRRAMLGLGLFALSLIVGALLAAMWLLPLIRLLPLSSRTTFTVQDAAWYALPAPLLATILVPTDFQFPEWTMYVGIVPALLALLALTGPRRRPVVFFAGLIIFAALYSIGPATFLFPLVQRLPGFSMLRVPPRVWFFGAFGVACLAAYGADKIGTPELAEWLARHQRLVRLALACAVSAAVAAIGVLWIMNQSPWRLVFALGIGAPAGAIVFGPLSGRLRRQGAMAVLAGLTMLDLIPTARLFTMAVPVESVVNSSPALDWLAAQPGLFRVYSPHQELPYAQAAARGVQSAEGLLAFQMRHSVELIKQATGCTLSGYATGVPPCLTSEIDPQAHLAARPNARLLGLLNVKYVLSSRPLDDADLELVREFGSQRIYQNRKFLPCAFVVSAAQTVSNADALLAALPSLEPGVLALLPAQLPAPLTGHHPPQEVNVISRRAGHWQLATDRQSPGMLIISETWVPGWRATDNGRPVSVLRADYALMGVYLAPGSHAVELVYDPPEWEWGWRISLVSVILVGLLGAGWLAQALQSRRICPIAKRNQL